MSIVFLNYDRLQETRQTVERLRLLLDGDPTVEVIAVDNGSRDGTAEYLQAQRDFLVPVLLRDNDGIAGYNRGFERARGEYLLVLDDDSCPLDRATLAQAAELMGRDPDLGVIACRIENPDGSLQRSWHLPPDPDRPAPSMSFIGCGFFIRRRLFQEIGWYPEDFFLYQNEIDVAIRVRLRGATIRYEPGCRVVHRGRPAQRPGWRRIHYPTRNTLWLIRRYFPAPQRWYLMLSRLVIGLLRGLWLGQTAVFLRAAREGLGQPQPYTPLPPPLLAELRPFRRQNSLLHQLLRIT